MDEHERRMMQSRMLTAVSESVDWSDALHRLRRDGFLRLPNALDTTACRALTEVAPEPWHELPPEEGVVRQNGYATGGPVAGSHAVVRQFADDVVSVIARASFGSTGPPSFNEVTWTLYPDGAGHITAHRDPMGVGGVIAIVTLRGTATFEVKAPHERVEWLTDAGDIVFLCGNGWPEDETRCPVHAVGPPVGGDRMILTLRHNKAGAGADYFPAPA